MIILDNKEKHCSQVLELESLVTSMNEELRKWTVTFKEQVDKLVMSDGIIEQLLMDNDLHTSKIINFEKKYESDVKKLIGNVVFPRTLTCYLENYRIYIKNTLIYGLPI